MNRKVKNPFDPERNYCFGCGIANPIGLKLEFEDSGEELIARWTPSDNYQGYINVLHGGIAATLLDEAAAWYVHAKIGTAGVTTSLNVKYLKPLYLSKGSVMAKARLKSQGEKTATFYCTLHDGDGNICTEAIAEFFIYPEEVAKRRFMYPGADAFTNKYENDQE